MCQVHYVNIRERLLSLFLQMRNLKFREVKPCIPNHTAQNWLVSQIHVLREATTDFLSAGTGGYPDTQAN